MSLDGLQKELTYVALSREFFERDTLTVARELVGAFLIDERVEPTRCLRLVEVEAYIGEDDPACHAARGLPEIAGR